MQWGCGVRYFHNLKDLQPQTSLLKGSTRIRSSLCVEHVAKHWACVIHHSSTASHCTEEETGAQKSEGARSHAPPPHRSASPKEAGLTPAVVRALKQSALLTGLGRPLMCPLLSVSSPILFLRSRLQGQGPWDVTLVTIVLSNHSALHACASRMSDAVCPCDTLCWVRGE